MCVCVCGVCMYMCIYVYVYVCACVCMCVHVCVHVCMHACVYACMCVYVYICVCVCVCMYVYCQFTTIHSYNFFKSMSTTWEMLYGRDNDNYMQLRKFGKLVHPYICKSLAVVAGEKNLNRKVSIRHKNYPNLSVFCIITYY